MYCKQALNEMAYEFMKSYLKTMYIRLNEKVFTCYLYSFIFWGLFDINLKTFHIQVEWGGGEFFLVLYLN
jgi:hypothetical protein